MNDSNLSRIGRRAHASAISTTLGLALACIMSCSAAGATRNWTGNAFNNNWSEPDNWSPSGPPQDGDALVFGQNATRRSNNNNLSSLQVQSIVFSGSSGGYTLNGNPIRLNVDITAAHTSGFNRVRCGVEFVDGGGTFSVVGAGQLEISGNVTLANNRLLGLYALGANLTLSGAIEGDGELIKLGEQALFLSGNAANTYTGPTTIKVGAMYLAKPSAARAISSQVVIGPDPQFLCSLADLEGGQYPPAMSMYVGPSATWSLTNGATVSSLTLDDGIIEGEGLLNLQGNVTNRGFSVVFCSLSLGSATRTFSLEYDDSFFSQLEIRGHILGPSSGANSPGLIKRGPGLLLLKNQNTYSGRTLIEQGTLYAMHSEALGTTAGETRVGPLGELALWSSVANIPLTCAEPLAMEGGRLYSLSDAIATGPLTLADYCEIDGPDVGRLVLNTTLTGPGGFTVSGGTVRLSGNADNTFAGDVLVEAGIFSPPVLELNKAMNSVAIPTSVTLQGFGTTVATLRNFQENGVRDLSILDGGVWHLNGFAATPSSLKFLGGGVVDTGLQGTFPGILNFTGAGVNTQLQVLPKQTLPSNYTARILGRVDFFSSTNDVFIPSGVTLDWRAEIRGIALQKRGPGKLVLGGDNRFLGQIFARDGELVSTDDHALGNHTTVADGATLWLASTFNFGSLTLAGRGFQNQGVLATDTLAIFSSNIILSASAAIQTPTTNSMLFINGPISGAGPLSKDGVGLLVFGGSTPNTFTGDLLVNAGTLELGKNDFVPAVPGDIVIGTGAAPGAHVLYSGHDQVWNRITVNRFSILDLNGRDEYSGDLTIGGGTIETRNGTLHLGAGVNLFVNTNTPVADASIIAGNLALGPGPHRFVIGNSGALFADLTFLGTLRQESTAAHIVKDGPGELELNVESTLAGAFTINDGLVIAEHSSAFGTSAGGTIVNGNGALKLTRGIWVREEPLTLNSVNSSAFGTIPLLNEPQYSNTWSGNITLQRTAGINVPDGVLNVSGGFDCCAGVISGPGGITKGGSGTLLITGFFPNDYTGPTVVNDGVLEAWRILSPALPGDIVVTGTNSALRTGRSPANTALASGASVTVKNGAEWIMNRANSENLRALLGDGRVGIAVGFGNSAALTVDSTNSCEFSGALSGFGSLDKRGPATLFLSGQSPFYGGTSTVHQGTFRVDGSISGSPVTVKGAAQLRGDGAVGNVTATEPDSVVRIDASFANHPDRQGGNLEVAHLTLGAGGVAAFDIFGPSPTGGNDLLIAHGPVNLNNARLSAGFNYPPREGDVVTLLRNNSPIPITGIFAGWPEGITRKLGDATVRASYRGGDGNDFTLTVTNLALGLGGYRLAEGNGNQTVEPDECNLLFISLFNRRGASLIVTNASLRAVTQGAAVTISSSSYPPIPAFDSRESLAPFQFRTEPTSPCGQPVSFELTVGVAGEGVFAVILDVPAGQGPDCERPTGGCESCHIVRGQFTANSPRLLRSPNFIGGPSLCFPPKRCPETNIFTDTVAVPCLAHTFTNSTTNDLCLTAQLRFDCLGTSTNALGAVAYLGTNDQHGPCVNYLGDSGADGSQPFSFRVPPATNFLLLVSARAADLECPSYTLELFGLPCPPPKLHIARDVSVDKVLLQWSTAYPHYRLQATNALGHPGSHTFDNVTNAAAVVGGLYTVTNPVAPAPQFYRLAK